MYSGVVKDNRDEENLGRVKVSVPAILPPDELVTARPALPYGHFFVPENETTVWVQFEGGDPGLPLWTGVQVVPGKVPEPAKADLPQRRVVTTPAGHVLLFDDRKGQETVEITVGQRKHVLTLDGAGVTLTDGVNGHSITLGAGGVVAKHKNGAKVELTAGSVSVDGGTGTVAVTGQAVQVTGKAVEVKGDAVLLGPGKLPVVRFGDSGIGNLGAPVVMTVVAGSTVLA
jgi:hypothetical protein